MRRLIRWLVATANPKLGGSGGLDLVPAGSRGVKGCAGCNDPQVETAWELRIGWRPYRFLGPNSYRCNVAIHLCADCLEMIGDLIATAASSSGAQREIQHGAVVDS